MSFFSNRNRSFLTKLYCIKILSLITFSAFAQQGQGQDQGNGKEGIKQAAKMVETYFGEATTLLYAIGAIVGIVGAVRVYNKWSSGDQDTSKAAASWFGACIFLVVVATVLKSFFGIK